MRRNGTRGSTLVEFVLVGLPSIFMIISVVEMGRGMWSYHTLARAVNVGARLAAVHGQGCTTGVNTCTVSVGTITTAIQSAGGGLLTNNFNVQLTTNSGAVTTCNPISNCTSSATTWPPATNSDNVAGNGVTISAQYTFNSALAMFWPGTSAVRYGTFNLPASTTQLILF
jgi:Flp pilus assembly protein TadG